MRCLLNTIYKASGVLAAACLASIGLLVLAQVVCRIINGIAKSMSGESLGLVVPSVAEFAAFLLVASAFLGLAYSMRHGSHIRVSLLMQKLSVQAKRKVEIFCLLTGFLLTAFCSWHVVLLVLDSWQFHEQSYGVISVSLWWVQLPMALGLVILAIALLDDLIAVLGGKGASYSLVDASEDMEVAE